MSAFWSREWWLQEGKVDARDRRKALQRARTNARRQKYDKKTDASHMQKNIYTGIHKPRAMGDEGIFHHRNLRGPVIHLSHQRVERVRLFACVILELGQPPPGCAECAREHGGGGGLGKEYNENVACGMTVIVHAGLGHPSYIVCLTPGKHASSFTVRPAEEAQRFDDNVIQRSHIPRHWLLETKDPPVFSRSICHAWYDASSRRWRFRTTPFG